MTEPHDWKTFTTDDWGAFAAVQWEVFTANPAGDPATQPSVVCGRLTVLPAASLTVVVAGEATGRFSGFPAATGVFAGTAGANGSLSSQPATLGKVEVLQC